jgi:hypothetical protein
MRKLGFVSPLEGTQGRKTNHRAATGADAQPALVEMGRV